jgi:hypothetical protein
MQIMSMLDPLKSNKYKWELQPILWVTIESCEMVILRIGGLDGIWACFLPSFPDL